MRAKWIVWTGLLVPFMFAGCLLVPGPRGQGVVMVPALPPVVVLEAEPYYVHSGYTYHCRDDGWYYSRSRGGPWAPLPRDHYPREVKFKGGGPDKGRGQKPEHRDR